MRKAIYAGSFDIPTKGHESVIKQAANIVDELVVVIALNPLKQTLFTPSERWDMLTDIVMDYKNVSVTYLPARMYTVNFAEQIGAQFLVRGIRNILDFVNEQVMAEKNLVVNPRVQTIFLIPDHKYSNVASSTVKQMMAADGWECPVREDIPDAMWPRFIELSKRKMFCNDFGFRVRL